MVSVSKGKPKKSSRGLFTQAYLEMQSVKSILIFFVKLEVMWGEEGYAMNLIERADGGGTDTDNIHKRGDLSSICESKIKNVIVIHLGSIFSN